MTSFWSAWVIILTSVTIVLMTWILISNQQAERRSGERTTGHEYDGIEEYDNPLPGWWFYMFLITIIWGIAYLIVYPGMGNFPGLLAGPRSSNTTSPWPRLTRDTAPCATVTWRCRWRK